MTILKGNSVHELEIKYRLIRILTYIRHLYITDKATVINITRDSLVMVNVWLITDTLKLNSSLLLTTPSDIINLLECEMTTLLNTYVSEESLQNKY